jgi:hypothetical protein
MLIFNYFFNFFLDEGLVQHCMDILEEVPDNVKAEDIIPWLYHEVIPHVQVLEQR